MRGAGAVVALVLLEWTAGWVGGAAWTQSWSVVRRGHFRIVAWSALVCGVLALLAVRSLPDASHDRLQWLVAVMVLLSGMYLLVQFSNTDVPGAVVGAAAAAAGVAALVAAADDVFGWPPVLAVFQLASGALLLGGVTNGMLLGHWYLNQPGLKPWALSRLTTLTLVAVALSGAAGLSAAGLLATASTQGAVLGLPGFGEAFGAVFYLVWLVMLLFTGAVVLGARRCVKLRSIQSATGLYYVAILTAGVSEFVVRYLMVNAS